MTLPPPTGSTRPAPPPLRLPTPRRRPGGFIASLLLHGLILLLIGRFGVQWVLGGSDDRNGPRGGGGGEGGAVRFIDLPAAAAPAPAQAVAPAPVHTVPPPELDPAPSLTPPTVAPLSMTVSPIVAAVGTATDGTTGQGPGTGGGTGSGVGTGVGNDSGPGSGGNGAYIPPSPRMVLLLTECKGQFTIDLSVAADGRVTHVNVNPEPKDAACRRKMTDRLLSFQFLPARRDGRAVAATYQMTWQY